MCTPQGIKPDPRKIKAIEEYPVPRTVKDIRSLIGLAGYYRRHVPNFTKLAQTLTNLTKKDVPFEWTGEHQIAFEELKCILGTEPLLIYPDFSQSFIVACDASTKAMEPYYRKCTMGKRGPLLIVVDN